MSTAGWILSILWTLIIVALVVAGIVWLVSALGSRGADARAPSSGPSAREILDRRLASGELTLEQYHQLRDTIEDPANATSSDHWPPQAVVTPT
jgi:putative membrane protein